MDLDGLIQFFFSRLIWEVSSSGHVKACKSKVENQVGKKIKAVKSDYCDAYYSRYDRLGEQRLEPFAKFLETK